MKVFTEHFAHSLMELDLTSRRAVVPWHSALPRISKEERVGSIRKGDRQSDGKREKKPRPRERSEGKSFP